MVGGEEETKTCASVRIMRMTPIMEIQLNNRDAPFLLLHDFWISPFCCFC